MPNSQTPGWRFVSFHEAQLEQLPGKMHHWYCRPDLTPASNLVFVRAQLLPGHAHRFHHHPHMEEILYILAGEAEQWVEQEKRILQPGDAFYVPAGIVHATFNPGSENLEFLAVLSPARQPGPMTVEVGEQEPWKSLRP